MRTLIVEDDFDARSLLQMLIRDLGNSDIAVNGREAVSAFQAAHQKHQPYDLILLDIMLPKLDGRKTLKRIRSLEDKMKISGKKQVPVIMISALNDAESIIGSFFQEGCDAYITKPYTKKTLFTEIDKLTQISNTQH